MLNRMKEGVRSVYRIAVLAEQEAERQRYAEQITRFCLANGLFPQVMQYDLVGSEMCIRDRSGTFF